jgi:hypothetical protein
MTEVENNSGEEEILVPDVVDDNEKADYAWCPKKECRVQSELCEKCDDKVTCPEHIRLSGENRHERAEQLDNEIEELKVSVCDSYFVLGRLLKAVRDGMYFKELGYSNLDEYADDRHGFKYRKASYLIAIVENCEAANLTKEDVRGIEWSKFKELPELTEENREGWLKKAAELSVEDLKAEVKKSKGEDPPEKKITMTFSFAEGQKELVESALDLAAKLTGSQVKSFHLQVLAEEFVATYGSADQAAVARFNNLYMDKEEEEE